MTDVKPDYEAVRRKAVELGEGVLEAVLIRETIDAACAPLVARIAELEARHPLEITVGWSQRAEKAEAQLAAYRIFVTAFKEWNAMPYSADDGRSNLAKHDAWQAAWDVLHAVEKADS